MAQLVEKGPCHQARESSSHPQDPHWGMTEPTPTGCHVCTHNISK